jgi:hypothetical protein
LARSGLASLRDPGQDGVARREAMRCAIELKNAEFNAQGVELNQRYQSGAIIWPLIPALRPARIATAYSTGNSTG